MRKSKENHNNRKKILSLGFLIGGTQSSKITNSILQVEVVLSWRGWEEEECSGWKPGCIGTVVLPAQQIRWLILILHQGKSSAVLQNAVKVLPLAQGFSPSICSSSHSFRAWPPYGRCTDRYAWAKQTSLNAVTSFHSSLNTLWLCSKLVWNNF